MKKVGLCVRYDCDNYGSMLQIYATQKAIENCGWKYEIIKYDKKTFGFLIKNIIRIFNPYFMYGKIRGYQKGKHLNKYPEIKKKNKERLQLFKAFRNQYIGPYSPVFKGYKNLVKGAKRYEAVMVGSDQLWTPAGIQSKFYNLLFVPKNIKKISLATSFGVTKVPKSQKYLTKKYLSRIDHLSVRELSGADIVDELIGRRPIVAADPTLLFSRDEWLSFFEEKSEYDQPYIFAYFLGTNPKHREAVKLFAEKKKMKIITCPCMDEFVKVDIDFGNEQRFNVNPIDFLNLIRKAEYIFTDSFHGSVFSIIEHKKFVTFNRYSDKLRKSKNTRIDSLFMQLGIQERHVDDNEVYIDKILDENIDYDHVDEKLRLIKESSLAFLKSALDE